MRRFITWYRTGIADLYDGWADARQSASENTARTWSVEAGVTITPHQLGSFHRLNLAVADIQRAIATAARP